MTYILGGDGPDLVVVGAHEDVGDVVAHLSHDPLVKVLGLRLCDGALHSSVNETVNGSDLVLLWQHGDVVLEGVWDPEALVADVGDALVIEPVILLGEGLLDAVIEVLVVGEDNVAAHVVQLVHHR